MHAPSPAAPASCADEQLFSELRRRVRHSELLPTALEKILYHLRFTGRLTVILHNGRVQRCLYEEGYSHGRAGPVASSQ
jgi:hypothetical protein